MIAANKWAVKSRRKASVKTVERKGKNWQKRMKVMATTREPKIQSTERGEKQNLVAAMNSLYFQVLCLNVFQFQLNRNVFYRYNDKFFVRNLESSVDKMSNGASHHEGFEIYTTNGHNKCLPFSFTFGLCFLRYFVLGIFSLFDVSFHGLYIKKNH